MSRRSIELLVISRTALSIACVLVASRLPAQAQKPAASVQRFAELARQLQGKTLEEKPDAQMSEALDILIEATIPLCKANPKLTDEQVEKKLAPYARVADGGKKDSFVTEPSWIAVHIDRKGSLCAIAATYGPISRLALVDVASGGKFHVPASLHWLYRWQQVPTFVGQDSLLILSNSIQDAGNRMGMRVDCFRPGGNEARKENPLIRIHNFDWGGANVNGNRLTLESLEDPKTFFVSAATPLLRRRETYAIEQGQLRRLTDDKLDKALRAADAWMDAAKRAARPDANQAVIQSLFKEQDMLEDYSAKPGAQGQTRVEMTFLGAKLRFLVSSANGRYTVTQAKVERRKNP